MPGAPRTGLHWHAQITSVKLRGYHGEEGYDRRVPFEAVMDIELLGGGRAFAHGALTRGHRLNRVDLARIGAMLSALGVTELLAERDGRMVRWWSAQAPSAPMDISHPADG
jgi:hypothetical protein